MKKRIFFILIISSTIFCSCSNKPSDKDIERKILLDYICNETAKVNSLTVMDHRDAESIAGFRGYEFLVSGEVVWESGCQEFGSRIPPGFKESFENKSVFLIKTEQGWQ